MVKKTFQIFLALALAVALFPRLAAASGYEKARAEYFSLIANEKRFGDAEEWRKLALSYQKAQKGSAKADDALYMASVCFEKAWKIKGEDADFKSASEGYLKLAKSYKKSNLADDGLMRLAGLYEMLGDSDAQSKVLKRVIKEFPKSDMAGAAKNRLKDAGKGAVLSKVNYWSAPTYTRIVFELKGRASFVSEALPEDLQNKKPPRIFVDLNNVKLSGGCPENNAVADGLVRRIRVGQYTKDTARVVLDLDAPARYSIFPLLDPYRVVVDVFREEGEGTQKDIIAGIIEDSKSCKMERGEDNPLFEPME
ncbi:AMIN domain-containing protein, partial [bacterium]